MPLTVQGGWLDGNSIRQARKAYRCQYWQGKSSGGFCKRIIAIGDFYCEGEMSDAGTTRNGMFLRDKYCLQCAGPEALASMPKLPATLAHGK